MKIAGHRGAAGLALENSLEAIRSALSAGVDAVEFDVRQTRSGDFVLSHDTSISRVSNDSYVVKDHDTEVLTSVRLHNGESIPTMSQALSEARNMPVILDLKGGNWAKNLTTALRKHKNTKITVISFNHKELATFHTLNPHISVYALEHTKPFDAIHYAKQYGFDGVDFNFWILNPLTYWMAKRQGLGIIVYTVNRLWIGRFLKLFFPDITITTDIPHKMQVLRTRPTRTDNKASR